VVTKDRHLQTLVLVALVVLLCDLATKELALFFLSDGAVRLPLLPRSIRFVLVANSGAAGGVWLGEYTRAINIGLTTLAIALATPVCRALAQIHRHAPMSLGLIVGAAMGNLLSLLIAPAVIDFIAIDRGHGRELVFNVADMAALFGLLLMAPITIAIVRQLRAARRTATAS
jgi:signal peptidase II